MNHVLGSSVAQRGWSPGNGREEQNWNAGALVLSGAGGKGEEWELLWPRSCLFWEHRGQILPKLGADVVIHTQCSHWGCAQELLAKPDGS